MDVAQLTLRIQTEGMAEAKRGMDSLGTSAQVVEETAKKAEQAASGMFTGAASAAVPFVAGMLTGTTVISGLTSAIRAAVAEAEAWDAHLKSMVVAYAGGVAGAYRLTDELRRQTEAIRDHYAGMERLVKESDSLQTAKAQIAALGPEFRAMLKGEIDTYEELRKAVEKVNQEEERLLNRQINALEKKRDKGSWTGGALTTIGAMLGQTGVMYGGVIQQAEFLAEKEGELNKLYEARAKVMKAVAESNKEAFLTAPAVKARTSYQPDNLEFTHPGDNWQRDWDLTKLNLQPATVSAGMLTEAMEKAREATGRLRLEVPTTWELIQQSIEQSSWHATDALVRWMDNLDGVGRSWKTLGDTVRSVIADMLIQMQRAIIQQQIMGQAMGFLSSLFNPTGNGGSPSFNTGTGNFGDPGFDANFGMARPSGSGSGKGGEINSSVVVNVTKSGAMDTENNGSSLELSRKIEGAVLRVLVNEKRPGGVLA